MADEYDYLFKCIAVGDGGAGKTALIVQFSQGFFQETYKLTIGVEFAVKTIEVNKKNGENIKVKLQIWDTGGQERFQHVRPLYYKGSMGGIVLFDLTNRESFDHIAKWIEEVTSNVKDIPLLLIGNKADLEAERVISREEAEEMAKDLNMFYVESSAKTGIGVGDVFVVLALLMIGEEIPAELLNVSNALQSSGAISAAPQQDSMPEPTLDAPAFKPKPIAAPTQQTVTPAPTFKPKPIAAPTQQTVTPAPAFKPKPIAAPTQQAVTPAPAFKPKPVAASSSTAHVAKSHSDFAADSNEFAPAVPKRPAVKREVHVEQQPEEKQKPVLPKKEENPFFATPVPKRSTPTPIPKPKATLGFQPTKQASSARSGLKKAGSIGKSGRIVSSGQINKAPVSKRKKVKEVQQPQSAFQPKKQSQSTRSNLKKAQSAPIIAQKPEKKKHSRFASFLSALSKKKSKETSDGDGGMFGFSSSNPQASRRASKRREPVQELGEGMVQCKSCGTVLSDRYKFCNKCGKTL